MTELRPDCSRCAGLCCVALPFSRGADFPVDKPGGVPCGNLLIDDRCGIHDRMAETGWRGCVTFDCFGAGQRVMQETFRGRTWRDDPDPGLPARMFSVLPVVHQLHEMSYLLAQAISYAVAPDLTRRCRQLAAEVDALAGGTAQDLLALDVTAVRARVGPALRDVSVAVRRAGRSPRHTNSRGSARADRRLRPGADGRSGTGADRRIRPGADLVRAALAGSDLRGADLRGVLLIAADLRDADLARADLLGADLRDADLRGARVAEALFVTPPQLAAARTDESTTRPPGVSGTHAG